MSQGRGPWTGIVSTPSRATRQPRDYALALSRDRSAQKVAAAQRRAHALAAMPIAVDPGTDTHGWDATPRLADAHRLTLHAASNLEPAYRRVPPLATHDRALAAPSSNLGLAVPGPWRGQTANVARGARGSGRTESSEIAPKVAGSVEVSRNNHLLSMS
jgi:hypothetical protein